MPAITPPIRRGPRKRPYVTAAYVARYDPKLPTYTGPDWIGVGIGEPQWMIGPWWIGKRISPPLGPWWTNQPPPQTPQTPLETHEHG